MYSLKALEGLDTTGLTRAAPRHEEVDRMYDLRLQFAAEVCVLGWGTTCLSSLGAALAAHIIHERMSMRGSAQLLKLLSDHNVIRTGMQNRMDNEHEWIGMIPEFRVANLNRRCYDPEVVQADNEEYGIVSFSEEPDSGDVHHTHDRCLQSAARPLWRCEHSVYKARPETIRRRSVARRRGGGAFKCGLWWRTIRSLLPNFVVPVALMFSSDKVTVVGNGNGGLYPACAQAHVRRQRLQVPVGGPTQIR